MIKNYINHVVFVLDASYSMKGHANNLIRVVDTQIEYLARRSEELNQETRVSIYVFSDEVSCVIYDMDVLRLPSIEQLYKIQGQTALIDATLKALEDLAHTATLYGDHAFLTYVLTDGQENRSRNRPFRLKEKLSGLASNWTVAALVPNQSGRDYSVGTGFQPDNVAVWNANSDAGIIEVGEVVRQATENFMVDRAKGVRGTRSLFSSGLSAVNVNTVHTNLEPLDRQEYDLVHVHHNPRTADGRWEIREYVKSRGFPYVVGNVFYQLTKREKIQSTKQIAIRERSSGKVFSGDNARPMLGLPNVEQSVIPNYNPEYDIFVQSTSVNRKLIPGTEILIIR